MDLPTVSYLGFVASESGLSDNLEVLNGSLGFLGCVTLAASFVVFISREDAHRDLVLDITFQLQRVDHIDFDFSHF